MSGGAVGANDISGLVDHDFGIQLQPFAGLLNQFREKIKKSPTNNVPQRSSFMNNFSDEATSSSSTAINLAKNNCNRHDKCNIGEGWVEGRSRMQKSNNFCGTPLRKEG
uniref:Uncharacterized protein n=1 Tax=Romanomermis culicivorax TaxID=13658 RepID=A0A915IUA1_ROMCU